MKYLTLLLPLVLTACSASAPEERKYPVYYCATPLGVAKIDTVTLGVSAIEQDGRLIVNDESQTLSLPLANCVARVEK